MARDYANYETILILEMTEFLALNPLANFDDTHNYFANSYEDEEIMNVWSRMLYPGDDDFDD